MHVKKFTSFCQALRKMHTEENWFLFMPHGVYRPTHYPSPVHGPQVPVHALYPGSRERTGIKTAPVYGYNRLLFQCFFVFLNVWLVVGLHVVFLLADCDSVSGFVCLSVFLLLRA